MKFEQFPIARAIKTNISKLGYKKPTDIQYKSIPHILRKEDVLAIAQTGTGKTAAFVIPILHLLQADKTKRRNEGVRCIVMAPTHELALQTTNVFNALSRNLNINTLCIYGGVDQEPQIDKLNQGVDIVVATPGRMFDLASQKYLNLQEIQILVLDEADHMLDLGFIKDIRDLMKMLPRKHQTLFFSATINEKIKRLAYSIVSNPIRIQVSPKNPVAKNIEHAVSYVDMDDKRFFLEFIIKNNLNKKILVFVRTKVRAERVSAAMKRVDILTETIHSDKDQEQRELTMYNFRKGKTKVLIATDVTARGIDIPNVEYVVNYDLPDSAENYVHRVGRTGRARNKGNAISFCSEEEKDILADIEKNLDKPIKRLEISKGEYQDIVDLSEDKTYDWKSLLNENNKKIEKRKNKKHKK